jgi:thioredoxin-like negative regulator of GroEL
MFEQTDVIQLDLGSMSQFYRRDEIWVIYFFNPDKKECQDFKDIYKDVSERLYGMVKVAAIDCG